MKVSVKDATAIWPDDQSNKELSQIPKQSEKKKAPIPPAIIAINEAIDTTKPLRKPLKPPMIKIIITIKSAIGSGNDSMVAKYV